MDGDADVNALGAAVTAVLCGHWTHDRPPRPAHYSHATARTVMAFIYESCSLPTRRTRALVRERIDSALMTGLLRGPDDSTTRWQLRASSSSPVKDDERGQAERLARS